MKKPVSPCKVDGVLCERHAVGCKASCAEWVRFQESVAEYREYVNGEKSRHLGIEAYRIESAAKNKTVRGKKKER